jgi:ubiquinone/menaquinone biosynthesis C-methylase UbiE
VLIACAASYVYTTRAGKFRAWDDLLAGLSLRGDEQVLDLGCGRGAVLLLAAQRLPHGKATGIDLWQAQDQSGNALGATQANAAAEGVAERVELHTGDMRKLPFPDASFDVVVSSLAIHNVPTPEGRQEAVREAARVLRAGGTILLADFRFTADYAKTLEAAGLTDVKTRGLGPRFWYGGPWAATTVVTARKPGS